MMPFRRPSLQETLPSPRATRAPNPEPLPRVPQLAHSMTPAYRKAFGQAHRHRLEAFERIE